MKKQPTKKKRVDTPVKTREKVQLAYGLLVAITFISFVSVAAAFTVSVQKKNSAQQAKIVTPSCRRFEDFNERLACLIEKFEERKEKNPEPLFLITPLDRLPGGGTCQANDINEKNEITGYCENANGHLRAVIWQQDGDVTNLRLPTNENSLATAGHAINEEGNIAGQSQLRTDQLLRAMTYVDGTMQAFAPFVVENYSNFEVDDHSFLKGINESNQMVGSGPFELVEADDIGDGDDKKMVHHAFLWDDGIINDLGSAAEGFSSWASDINNQGMIVGEAQLPFGDAYINKAAVWQDKTQQVTIIDQRQNSGAISSALAVNEQQPAQVVGQINIEQFPGTFYSHGFLWSGEDMRDLGTYGNCGFSIAKDINNASNIVGESWGYPCGDDFSNYKALIWTWRDGDILATDINNFINDARWHLSILTGINDSNYIVGYGILNGQREAFLLTPNK